MTSQSEGRGDIVEASAMKKTTGDEYFYRVPGLMVPRYMASATMESDIERFIDWVPNHTGTLEAVSENEDLVRGPHSFLPRMEKLYVMLCSIYAHWLEREAARILRMAQAGETEICRTLAIPFVSNVRTLALDIQMAQNGKFESDYKRYGSTENYRDIISGVKLISMLLQNSDYEKALDVSKSIDELRGSEYSAPLTAYILSGTAAALSFADEIISTYSKKIDDSFSGTPGTTEKKKVMIVDDMPEILVTLGYMLEDHYQVVPFTGGVEALDYIAKKQVDAFILDIDMPGMDGFTLAKRIRDKPRQKDTPIIFLTGNSTRETLVKALMFAPKAFIVKPANKDVIIAKLDGCLQS